MGFLKDTQSKTYNPNTFKPNDLLKCFLTFDNTRKKDIFFELLCSKIADLGNFDQANDFLKCLSNQIETYEPNKLKKIIEISMKNYQVTDAYEFLPFCKQLIRNRTDLNSETKSILQSYIEEHKD